jgi:hypothetical protein
MLFWADPAFPAMIGASWLRIARDEVSGSGQKRGSKPKSALGAKRLAAFGRIGVSASTGASDA